MIAAGDRVYLPPDVHLEGDALYDLARGAAWPLNDSGRFILARTDGRPLAEIAAGLAERYGFPRERALGDTRAFCADLNAKLLLNLAPRGGALALVARWIALAVRLLPLGILPGFPRERRPIETEGAGAAALSVVRVLGRRALVTGCLVAAAAAFLLAGLGAAQAGVALALGASAALGLLAHEVGHAALLRGVPCSLGLAGMRAFLLHPALSARRRLLVSTAGPVAALLAGWLALVSALPFAQEELALFALPLVAHGLGLTALSRDGRAACGLS